MASVHRYPKRDSWRISYYLRLRDQLVKKAKYSKLRPDANLLKRQLENLEHATRTGLASETEINEWVERGWLKEEEAKTAAATNAKPKDLPPLFVVVLLFIGIISLSASCSDAY